MRCKTYTYLILTNICLLSISVDSALLRDVLAPSQSARLPRDNKYYSGRYGTGQQSSSSSVTNSPSKSGDELEAREATQNPVEKRCTRCDRDRDRDYYDSLRYPYESGRGRYDDRRNRDRDYDDRRGGYDDHYDTDRYRRPYYERERDRYDRDRYDRDRYDRYDGRDRNYDGRDRNYGGGDRNYEGRDRNYDRDYREYDRGFGYDNRGYDYREKGYGYEDREGSSGGRGSYGGRYDGGGYASGWNYGGGRDEYRDKKKSDYHGFKPLDETYRGVSGFDSKGRGFYFASGIPYWLDFADDRYGGSRVRDPYAYDGYRSTSYLYGRPSSTTTNSSVVDGDAQTQNPQENSG